MRQNIRIGIKIATRNLDLIPEIYANRNIIDFIEIILLPEFTKEDIQFIRNLQMPYAIHIPAGIYDLDFGNIQKQAKNLSYIKKINQSNKELNAFCYIVHPESRDIELSLANISKLQLGPLAMENMPRESHLGGELLGFDPPGLQSFFKRMPALEFCFDISHAIKAAISLNTDPLTFINEFLAFKKPIIFHIAGGTLSTAIDEHLNLYEGQYALSEIKRVLLRQNYNVNLTFETPKSAEKTIKNDLKNIKYFLNL